jgi:hypothetical protein
MRFTFGAQGACRAPEPFSQGRQDILNAALAAEAVPDLPLPAVGRPVRQMALLEERNVNDGECHTGLGYHITLWYITVQCGLPGGGRNAVDGVCVMHSTGAVK